MPEITFDLLIPSNGRGPTHLAAPGRVGFLCGTRTGRQLFQQIGIVGPDAGTCDGCRTAAAAIVAANR